MGQKQQVRVNCAKRVGLWGKMLKNALLHDNVCCMTIKKCGGVCTTEPKAESILIDDDDDDDADGSQQDYRGMPQASTSHSLWYKIPQGPKHHANPRHKLGKQYSSRKCFGNPHALVSRTGDCFVEPPILFER